MRLQEVDASREESELQNALSNFVKAQVKEKSN